MVSWGKFVLAGEDAECLKSVSVKTELKPVWNDQRFSKEQDWLQYSPKSINNDNDSAYFILSSDPISTQDFTADVQVTARAGSQIASITFQVTIKVGADGAKKRIKAAPPALHI